MELSKTPVNISGNSVITCIFLICYSVLNVDFFVYQWYIYHLCSRTVAGAQIVLAQLERNTTLLVSMSGQSDPLAGFGSCKTTLEKIYLLQVKTGSKQLDDALYGIAHPDSSDVFREYTYDDVAESLDAIARHSAIYGEIAAKLAAVYRKEFC